MPAILIVDNSADILEVMSLYLRSMDYTVETAISKEEMFKQLKAAVPDLVILDVQLGNTNGAELCKQLKLQFPALRVMLTSDSAWHLKDYLLYCADGIMEKPFNLFDLRNVVSKVLQDTSVK